MAKRIGELLVEGGVLSQSQLEQALFAQRKDGRKLGQLLVELGLVTEVQVTQTLSRQLSVPWVSLYHVDFSRSLLNLVPRETAEKYCLIPIFVRRVRKQGETLYVAMDDPSNEDGLRSCAEYSGLPVRSMIAPPQDIRSAIRVYYGVAPRPPSQPAPPMSVTPAPPPPAPPPPSVESTPKTEPVPTEAAPTEPEPATRRIEPAAPKEITPPPPPIVEVQAAAADEGPHIEAVEIEIPRSRPPPVVEDDEPPPSESGSPSERPVTTIPRPRGKTPRMVSLTLLDGTTISLPAKSQRGRPAEPEPEVVPEPPPSGDGDTGLTARDLVTALRAVAQGADGSEVLGGDVRWESAFAALLSLLLKKHLIADWEFVDELKKMS